MKGFLNNLEQEIMLIDERGEIKFYNEKLRTSLGYSQEEMQQMRFTDIAEYLKEDRQEWKLETSLYHKKGQELQYTLTISKYESEGTQNYFIIGTPKTGEEQLKSDFFANVSHEFKTPINIMLSTTQLLEQILNEDEVLNRQDLLKYMKYIKQNGYRLLRLVNNLIDSNKIEAGYYELQMGNYNIIEVVEEITQSVVEYVTGKGVELIFDTEKEEVVMGFDPEKVERIMLNLLSNAVKYVKDQGKIEVSMAVEEDWVSVAVRDNGIGIPEEKLEDIFDRFTQVDNELVKKSQGSGIGLALVKALVELHDGTIVATSKEGEGTTICFTLPIRQVEEKIGKGSVGFVASRIEKCSIEFADVYY